MPRPRPSLTAGAIALAAFLLFGLWFLTGCQKAPDLTTNQLPKSPELVFEEPTPSPTPAAVSTPTPSPSPSPSPSPKASPTPPVRDRIIYEASRLVGLKETHGPNRSPVIDAMNRLTGAEMGSPWCASFNAYVYNLAKVPKGWPRSAWSPDWVANPTWTRAKGGTTPLPGDSFGVYFPSKGRVAHTGLIEKWGDSVLTLEGNTGPTGSVGEADRNGDGSYRKRRLRTQIHSVRSWIP